MSSGGGASSIRDYLLFSFDSCCYTAFSFTLKKIDECNFRASFNWLLFSFSYSKVRDLYLNERVELMSFLPSLSPSEAFTRGYFGRRPCWASETTLAYYAMLGEETRPSPEVSLFPLGNRYV